METNEVTVFNKLHGGDRLYYNRNYMTVEELYNDVRGGKNFIFKRQPEREAEFLLSGIKLAEVHFKQILVRDFKGDTALLNRIIRGGGFTAYASKLELKLC